MKNGGKSNPQKKNPYLKVNLMPDEFADVLDRLDINFEDAANAEMLLERLDSVLGRPASMDQFTTAQNKFQEQAQRATTLGFSISRFQRGGNTVLQLRDSRGRFVTDTVLVGGTGGRRVVRGAGRIESALRSVEST